MRSIQRCSAGVDRFLLVPLGVAVGLLLAGLVLPFVKITELFLFSNNPSLLQLVGNGLAAGEWFVSVLVLAFSILFPTAKLALLAWLYIGFTIDSPALARAFDRLALIEKWSMADVLVVALIVVSLKSNMIVEATVELGAYVFAAHALLAMAVGYRMKRAYRAHSRHGLD